MAVLGLDVGIGILQKLLISFGVVEKEGVFKHFFGLWAIGIFDALPWLVEVSEDENQARFNDGVDWGRAARNSDRGRR